MTLRRGFTRVALLHALPAALGACGGGELDDARAGPAPVTSSPPTKKPPPQGETVRADGAVLRLAGDPFRVRGATYSPRNLPGDAMWTAYSHWEVEAELALLYQLGVNVVRVLVPYAVFASGAGARTEDALRSLSDLVALADLRGQRVWLTLLPDVDEGEDDARIDAHLDAITDTFAGDGRVFGYTVLRGFDRASAPTPRARAIARRALARLHARDPKHLAGVGAWGRSLGDRASPVFADDGTYEGADFVSFHWYERSDEVTLGKALAEASRAGKPVLIEETGLPEAVPVGSPLAAATGDQRVALLAGLAVALELQGTAGATWWQPFDPLGTAVVAPGFYPPLDARFGLYDASFELKDEGLVYRDLVLPTHARLPGYRGEGEVAGAMVDAFARAGGSLRVGAPFDAGQGSHARPGKSGAMLQDFRGGEDGRGQITLSPIGPLAHWVYGPFFEAWSSRGGPSSELGWATSDATKDGNVTRMTFEHGAMRLVEPDGVVTIE